jgi:hypothetical protein
MPSTLRFTPLCRAKAMRPITVPAFPKSHTGHGKPTGARNCANAAIWRGCTPSAYSEGGGGISLTNGSCVHKNEHVRCAGALHTLVLQAVIAGHAHLACFPAIACHSTCTPRRLPHHSLPHHTHPRVHCTNPPRGNACDSPHKGLLCAAAHSPGAQSGVDTFRYPRIRCRSAPMPAAPSLPSAPSCARAHKGTAKTHRG